MVSVEISRPEGVKFGEMPLTIIASLEMGGLSKGQEYHSEHRLI